MIVKVPNKVSSDFDGFNSLIKMYHQTKSLSFDTVTFDFSNCSWFEANLCAVLGAICDKISSEINSVNVDNMSRPIETILSKNEFLKHFGGSSKFDSNNTTIKYRRYKASEQTLFKEYLNTELLSKEEMPSMSELLQKKVNESIFEIFENAITHGESHYVFSCGQYYPQKVPPRIDFTIVDYGNTIKSKVNSFLNANMSASETIAWAVDKANTTKEGDTPGGLGLKVIRKFLQLNRGEIQIVSANGYWCQDKNNNTFVDTLDYQFDGTIVNLEFNIDDHSSYILAEELKSKVVNNIF